MTAGFPVTPVLIVAGCLAAACGLSLIVDGLALPRRVARSVPPIIAPDRLADLAARFLLVALVYAFFFAISWRPFYALGATVTLHIVFTAVSRAKFRFVREPLVFADIALLPILLRHKELFYANFIGVLFWIGCLAYVFGASALFYWFEPTLLPPGFRWAWVAGGVALAFAPWLALAISGVRTRAGRTAETLIGLGEPKSSTLRFGAFAYVVLHFLAWLSHAGRAPAVDRQAAVAGLTSVSAGAARGPIVIVWQSESFFDMRRLDVAGLRLPVLDRLRRRAARWGLLASIFEGGYTMRTEFSTIAGVSPALLGPDAFFPYLRPIRYAASAWPNIFREAGFATTFIHPYDRYFFRRHRAIPRLGFSRMLMLDAFEDSPGAGPYVTDARLADHVLEICQTQERPQFVFVASMENHGPWRPDRLGGNDGSSEIYLRILERTDAAIGRLVEGLDELDRPVWLVFFGDHAPLLDTYPDGFPDPRTDYVIVASGTVRGPAAESSADSQPWTLLDDLLHCAAGSAPSALSPETPE